MYITMDRDETFKRHYNRPHYSHDAQTWHSDDGCEIIDSDEHEFIDELFYNEMLAGEFCDYEVYLEEHRTNYIFVD